MNKRIILYFCGLLVCCTSIAQTQSNDPNWQLKWEDQFNTFNTNRWEKAKYVIHGDNPPEPQLYLENQVWTANGNLIIEINNMKDTCPTPAPTAISGACGSCESGTKYNYKSGWIETTGAYDIHYGYIEARIKFPYKKVNGKSWGFWPAFWTFVGYHTNSNPAEIDIFEVSCARHPVNEFTTNVHTCYNSDDDPTCDEKQYSGVHAFQNFQFNDWHTYAIEWNRNRIIWYLDGKAFRTLNNHNVIDPVRLILNMGVDRKNLLSTFPPFQEYMFVDYVKVYCLKCDKNTVVNEISNFNTYHYTVKKSITLSNATTIPAGSNISLRANDFIELKPGFEVQTGKELYLDVSPCETCVPIAQQAQKGNDEE